MDKEIRELRESIDRLKAERDAFRETYRKNEEILRTSATAEEAEALQRSGKATAQECRDYAEQRHVLEMVVNSAPEIIRGTNELIRIKEQQLQALTARRAQKKQGGMQRTKQKLTDILIAVLDLTEFVPLGWAFTCYELGAGWLSQKPLDGIGTLIVTTFLPDSSGCSA